MRTESHVEQPKRCFIFLSYLILGIVAAWMSPYLYLDEALKRAFASLTAPAVAHFLYPEWPASEKALHLERGEKLYEGEPRPPITVALLTDDDLEAYGTTYPVSYGFHADRLESIASRKPKAIFIDIAFLDARPDKTIDELTDVLCAIRDQGIPVFLAALDNAGQSLRKELEDVAVNKACVTKVAVPRQLDSYDHVQWEYPLRLGNLDAPALAIYKALHPASSLNSVDEFASLGMLWGLNPHAYNVKRMRQKDGEKPDGTPRYKPLCRSGYAIFRDSPLLGAFGTMLARDTSGQRDLYMCPFHLSIPLHYLSEKNGELADALLRDRVVIYGVDLQSVGDSTFSPIHGVIAGPFAHAMALDNLYRFGAAYPQAINFELLDLSNPATRFSLLMITLIAAVVAILRGRTIRWPEALRLPWPISKKNEGCCVVSQEVIGDVVSGLLIFFGKWCAYLVLLVFIGWVGQTLFQLSILSWLEYALFPLIINTFDGGRTFACYLQEKWERCCP